MFLNNTPTQIHPLTTFYWQNVKYTPTQIWPLTICCDKMSNASLSLNKHYNLLCSCPGILPNSWWNAYINNKYIQFCAWSTSTQFYDQDFHTLTWSTHLNVIILCRTARFTNVVCLPILSADFYFGQVGRNSYRCVQWFCIIQDSFLISLSGARFRTTRSDRFYTKL